MMKTSAMSAAFVAVILAFLLGMPQVATAQGSGQDTLIVGVHNDTPNLHPWDVATNSVWKSFLWRQWVYEGLYGLSPDGSIYPVLASGFTVSPSDPLNVTVTLRTGITFTDGTPMTADDVIFTFQTMGFNSQLSDAVLKSITWQDPPMFDRWNATTSAWGATHESHVGIIKVDATHVRFQLRQTYSMFFFSTLTTPIMPMHIWKDHLVEVALGAFTIPGGVTLNQGTEFDFDRNFGSSSSEVQATIGTGPWYLDYWTPLTSAKLRIYEGYWGKTQTLTWQGRQWPFFPNNLKTIQFNIYGILDVAILALKNGDVHVVPWDLPSGFYNDLRHDPRIGFQISAADGFFYLAFNMRREPFNDLNFRKAVSYAIDKDFIVDRLLAGFGIKGQSPISPINPAYINSSATTPPFDKTQAISILDAAGYTDQDGDGWRDFPDGRPIKYNILTPAKDYDPSRADAGIMIANNLKAIGLNIDSAPTAFDAIVSAAFVSASFDMFVLGWVSLGPYPETYLAEFFGCDSDVLLGVGSNAPGYCSTELEQKLTILDQEMNDAVRIQAAKDAEGILTRDLPYNTLYSKRWIEGYRQDIWGGWISVNGEIFNGFSIGVLGKGGPSVPTGPLTVSLNGPGQVLAGTTATLQAYVVQQGQPAANVDVNITAVTGDWANGTTNFAGYAAINFPIPYVSGETAFIAKATTTLGDIGGDILNINVVLPNDIAQVLLSTTTPVVTTGGSATITAKVVDKAGNPIANVPVGIIPELVLGSVTPAQGTTGVAGTTTFTYTPPPVSKITNRNQFDYIKAEVDMPTRPKLPDIKTQTLAIGVENSAYDWQVLEVQSVTDYIVDTDPVSPIPATSTVTVLLTDQTGNPISGQAVTATVSQPTAMSIDQATKTTSGTGTVSFTFTAQTSVSTPVSVNFTVQKAFFAMSGLCLLVTDGTTADYATSMTMATRFADPNSAVSLTVDVYDITGASAPGVEVDILIPYNEQGNPTTVTLPEWSTITYVGNVFTDVTNGAGRITTTINMKSFPADSVVTLETGIAGFGPQGAFLLGSPSTMYFTQHLIEKRNKLAAVSSWAMEDPVLTKENTFTNVTVNFADSAGPKAGLPVSLYRGLGDLRPGRGAIKIGDFVTDGSGQVKTGWTEAVHDVDTSLGFTVVYTDTNYALGGVVGSVPFEQKFAYLVTSAGIRALFPTGTPPTTAVRANHLQTYAITVKDVGGQPVQDVTVRAMVAGNVTARTTAAGTVTLSVAPGTTNPTATDAWETLFELTNETLSTTIQMGTLVGVGSFVLSGLQIPGSATVGQKATVTATVTNNGPVLDTAVVVLRIDNVDYQMMTVDVAGKDLSGAPGTATVSFTYVPYDASAHTLTLVIGSSSVQGSLTAGGAGGDLIMTIGLGIVFLVVGIIIGILIGRRPKAPKPEEAPMPEVKPQEPKA